MKRALALVLLAGCEASPPPAPVVPEPSPPPSIASAAVTAAASTPARPVVGTKPYKGSICESGADGGPPAAWVTHEAAARVVDAPYTSRVVPGNQRAIGPTATTWAHYLNGMHNAMHPQFADAFLGWLCTRPLTDAANDVRLITRLEIVIASDGSLADVGVVRSSGIREFDLGAVESVERIAPLPKPDPSLLSSDGRAYVHWAFFRDEVFACSTMHARPFMLALGP